MLLKAEGISSAASTKAKPSDLNGSSSWSSLQMFIGLLQARHGQHPYLRSTRTGSHPIKVAYLVSHSP